MWVPYRQHFVLAAPALLMVLSLMHGGHARAEETYRRYADSTGYYPSRPAGMILEGEAIGMDAPATLEFDGKSNTFLLDGAMRYENPVSWSEWLIILAAIRDDDRFGVSVSMDKRLITYGGLSARSKIADTLMRADRMLASVCFGSPSLPDGVRLPDNYIPVKLPKRNDVIICFGLTNFTFTKQGDAYVRSQCDLETWLMAVTAQKAADGGHIQDEETTAKLESEMEQTNINHLKNNHDEYLKIPLLAAAASYGEAAAFARFLRESGFDLAAMHTMMSVRRPVGVMKSSKALRESETNQMAESNTPSAEPAQGDVKRESNARLSD